MKKVVVAVDPSMSSAESACECGIIVCALGLLDNRGYILADCSARMTPDQWARLAISLADEYKAVIVCEANLPGSDLIKHTIGTVRENVPLRLVHARTGKRSRAEPIAALYEQHRVSHCGVFSELEDQLTGWDASVSSVSPDRLDALVHGLSALLIQPEVEQPGRLHISEEMLDACVIPHRSSQGPKGKPTEPEAPGAQWYPGKAGEWHRA
jgi:phage terminase large subunit-like protein